MLTHIALVFVKLAEVGVFKITFFDSYFILYITTTLNIRPLLRFMRLYTDLNSHHVTKNSTKFICKKIDI
jgi:hypothetical protein